MDQAYQKIHNCVVLFATPDCTCTLNVVTLTHRAAVLDLRSCFRMRLVLAYCLSYNDGYFRLRADGPMASSCPQPLLYTSEILSFRLCSQMCYATAVVPSWRALTSVLLS